MRPASSTCSALMNPCPSAPSSWLAGTRQFSKITSLVSLARIPSLSSFLPARNPGVPRSTMNAEMPRLPFARVVTAITTMRSPVLPCVMNCLVPLMTQPSPSRTARVCIDAASLPDDASVSPQAASCSPVRQRDEVLLLLRLGAEHEDVRGAEPVVCRDRQAHRRIDAGQLLDADAVVHRRHRRPAVAPRETGFPSARARRTWTAAPAGTAAPRPTP